MAKNIDKWETFGYDTDLPCCVCKKKPAKTEPRFCYPVCKDCMNIPPVKINDRRTDGK